MHYYYGAGELGHDFEITQHSDKIVIAMRAATIKFYSLIDIAYRIYACKFY